MSRKKITTRTCGKCETVFPAGRGHNARTCGLTKGNDVFGKKSPPTPLGFEKRLAQVSAELKITPDRENDGGGDSGESQRLVYVKKLVPRELFASIKYLYPFGEVRIEQVSGREGEKLPTNWLNEYNCVSDRYKTVWFDSKGYVHRAGSEPAVEYLSGHKEWWLHGNRHRLDGPAVDSGGVGGCGREWWVNNQLHRLDGPAVERLNGHKEWRVKGELHRTDGPAVERVIGIKEWWLHNKLHRVDGPAVEEKNGDRKWFLNGGKHRVDGPAVEYADGRKEWWVNDIFSKNSHLCEKATLPTLTREEFYELCIYDDYVVRQLAMFNPNCPVEYKILAKMKNNAS